MNFDHIFEDLAALFESGQAKPRALSHLERCNVLRLSDASGGVEHLLAPILGKDFVGGISDAPSTWSFFPMAAVTEIVAHNENDPELPRLRSFDRLLLDLVASFELPAEVGWVWPAKLAVQNRGMLVALDCGLLIVETFSGTLAISTAALAKLTVKVVDNLGEDSQIPV